MIIRHPLILLLICIPLFYSCAQGEAKEISKQHKINGISFVAAGDTLQQDHIKPVLDLNANYAAVMPFGFIRSLDHPELAYNANRQWFGETFIGVKQYVDLLHHNKIKVMLKPQIWVSKGEYTGNVKMENEEAWTLLEKTYSSFILDFAKLAEESQVDMFCIGTELEKFIEHRPEYWEQLIKNIRAVYKGKLTYAANWDEYKRVPFWKSLDYVGIDAYFPVSESKTPSLEECKIGWMRWKEELKAFSEKEQRQILFAEYGYRSVDYAGKEPWKSDRSMTTVNLEAQVNTTQALYEEVWSESWFAGGFLWKWFIDHNKVGGIENSQFTPQNKPAENMIRQFYQK
ncbi:glycoside hydrolase family 113 [Ulvibacter antarcticus]|uniref:Gene Transfer Agent (GTA)-like protein n=1 Tax=Ulvibacter antarcticus TaxID=442714 RepID=A0A3L9Z4S3_9FLAO|nr:glycoside hydrolase [Ulvibacter antarcticus]RMA66459.1 hypothetical protein BXY75_0884 [Ulvibacter antarcticus]